MLTTEQRTVLRVELLNDPLGVGYAVMGHDEAAASLNAATRTVHRQISMPALLRWAVTTGAIRKLRAGMTSGNESSQAVSEVALSLLSSNLESLSLDAELRMLLASLVAAQIFTQADVDALFTRAAEVVSRCDELLGTGAVCDNQDVYICRVEMGGA